MLSVNRKFQLVFLGFTFLMASLAVLGFYAGEAYFFWKFNLFGHYYQLPKNHYFFTFLRSQQQVMDRILRTLGVTLSAGFGTMGFLFSRKFIAPQLISTNRNDREGPGTESGSDDGVSNGFTGRKAA